MTIQEIKDAFNAEFGTISDKFIIIEENLNTLASSNKDCIYHPGVYVFYLDGKVIKVGRHLINSRKRALEHIRDNTKNAIFEMKSFKGDEKVKILLFNLKDLNDNHWSASAEMYLEKKLNPAIRAKRKG